MRLTETHAKFWQERKATPGWVLKMRAERKKRYPQVRHETSIHECINAHAGILPDESHHAGNLMLLLRRLYGTELRETLNRIATSPGTFMRPERRAGYARKWARKLSESRVWPTS